MKQNHHFVVTPDKIKFVHNGVSEYQFNTNTAKHTFCTTWYGMARLRLFWWI